MGEEGAATSPSCRSSASDPKSCSHTAAVSWEPGSQRSSPCRKQARHGVLNFVQDQCWVVSSWSDRLLQECGSVGLCGVGFLLSSHPQPSHSCGQAAHVCVHAHGCAECLRLAFFPWLRASGTLLGIRARCKQPCKVNTST